MTVSTTATIPIMNPSWQMNCSKWKNDMPRKDPEARKEYSREYAEKNRAVLKEYKRKYYLDNKAREDAKRREHHIANREKENSAASIRYYANREVILVRDAVYRGKHKEEKRERDHAYYLLHRDEISAGGKLDRIEHRDEIKAKRAVRRIVNREKILAQKKASAIRHPEEARLTHTKSNAKYLRVHPEKRKEWKAKRRALGFVSMNQPFVGCEGHHINKSDVIYIPKEMHHSVFHDVWTGRGMAEINAKVFAWYTEDWT
jgi:hypothetical protein